MSSLPSINLDLSKRLREDEEFRREFFLAESSAEIARQLIKLRHARSLNQGDVAKRIGTGQSAISRIESADYRSWSFNTLRKVAEAMGARIRVLIEPIEDVLWEYEPRNEMVRAVEESRKATAIEIARIAKKRGFP